MANIFVNATTARRDTRNNSIIHSEIRSIEAAVLANIDAGVLYANVNSNTTMTDVYNGVTNDATKLDQVNYVKDYFTGLGYGVSILTNTTTEDTITWNISW